MRSDIVIIGAGFYGLYAARFYGNKGLRVLVLEKEQEPFQRASYINQARVHMGYHYPRSLSTAIASAGYFERFYNDFKDCINAEFEQIYATGERFSWTTASEFKVFCKNAGIPCEEVETNRYFKHGTCDGAFKTKEYAYDAVLLRNKLIDEISSMLNVTVLYSHSPEYINQDRDVWHIKSRDVEITTPFILNTTYAGVNEIHMLLGYEPFKIKYEKCEIILCNVNEKLRKVGLTVMDGPFFSIMPFGKTGLHSLTSVSFTPHETSYDDLPKFECQVLTAGFCRPKDLSNCNTCKERPKSSWDYMSQLARKYISNKYEFRYYKSLFVIKPILQASELNDSRPTVIREVSINPKMISVLSGKINTVYDLEEVLI